MGLKLSSMPQEQLTACSIKQTDGKLSTDIDGETVLMDLQSGTYSSFNAVASHIWGELQKGNQFTPLLESILEKFDVERTVAYNELISFLDELSEKNFIEVQI